MGGERILLVEDDEDLSYAVALQLDAKKYEVITACDGQEGLNKARKEKPRLIILDLMLPKIDGYKVCRMLKFDDKFKHIPIIIFTARAQESDKNLAFEVGADAYITKPFDPVELFSKIEQLLKV